jgi:tRNA (cytidine/uridine-2'-O-)-methyltransferase
MRGGGRRRCGWCFSPPALGSATLDHAFSPADILLFGRESAGVPEAVHQAADARLKIPMREGLRSINVAMAAAMALGEAIRQTGASTMSKVAP